MTDCSATSPQFDTSSAPVVQSRRQEAAADVLFRMAPSAIFTVDLQRRVTTWNKQAAALTGYLEDEILGQPCTTFASDPCGTGCGLFSPHVPKPYFGGQCTVRTKDGDLRTVSKNIELLRDESGNVIGGIECFEDIEERKRAEEALSESERIYRTLVEAIDDAINIKDSQGRYILVNSALASRLGRPKEEILGKTALDLYPPQTAQDIMTRERQVLDTGMPLEAEESHETVDGDRVRLVRKVPLRNDAGEVTGIVTVSRDITERKNQEMQLSYLASHDPLTGLPNRRSLEHALKSAVHRAKGGEPSCLLFLDLDDFKQVNDTLGHEAGDHLLLDLAALLHKTIRGADILARLGGDEFAILLTNTPINHARAIAERCLVAVDSLQFSHEGHGFDAGVSVGMVVLDGALDSSQALSMADAAMYQAKELGGRRVCVFQPEDDQLRRLSDSNRMAIKVREAIRDDLLVLHFQPIVRLCDGQIEHYEALVRMKGQEEGLISPRVFIPVAERCGMMPGLTRWVVTKTIKSLECTPDVRIFINLSPSSIGDDQLLEFIGSELRRSAIVPGRLGFEVTDAGITRDMATTESWIRRLKSLGCRVALGQFGTGYSSLTRLRTLPVDQIKIDGWLIRALEHDQLHKPLVEAIRSIAQSTGKDVVAESVESDNIAAILRDSKVEFGQGYYLGRPGPYLQPIASASPIEVL